MFGKHLRRHDVANSPVIHEWQKSVCKTDAFFVVLHLGDEESVKHVLIVVFVRKLLKKILAFCLLCKFFCELAKHRHTNAYETLHRHSRCQFGLESSILLILPTERQKEAYNNAGKDVTEGKKNKMMVKDTLIVRLDNQKELDDNSRNSDRKASLKREQQKNVDDIIKAENQLPELTIPNLYKEIIRNRILYPKIVLAQAILETGWFRSSVCRNKHNLFGLTNPRTGKYYEFNHWTESVRAYYTKVQYKYKVGNYLLWLDEIGYAEDPNYIIAVIRILKTL